MAVQLTNDQKIGITMTNTYNNLHYVARLSTIIAMSAVTIDGIFINENNEKPKCHNGNLNGNKL